VLNPPVADKGQFHSALLEQKEGPFLLRKKVDGYFL
jgi:hypothetical protein